MSERYAKRNAIVIYIAVLLASIGGFVLLPRRDARLEEAVLVLLSAAVLLHALIALPKLRGLSPRIYRLGLLFLSVGLLLDVAWADWILSAARPQSFSMHLTKLDALYFMLTTAATVGYGDIHPATELARGVVMIQMLLGFGLVGYVITRAISGPASASS